MTGATGPRGPSDGYIASAPSIALSTNLATVATLTLPPTSAYLVWAKVNLVNQSAEVRSVGCYLTTGADGSLTGAFDLSQGQLVPAGVGTLPMQGYLFVSGTATTVRVQCDTTIGTDVLAGGKFQAVKVGTLTVSP